MNKLFAGAIAGLIATIPMTIVMKSLHRRLPASERYPLPPREIVDQLASQTNLDDKADDESKRVATFTAHFAYGAATGALYAPLAARTTSGAAWSPLASGAAYGVLVWTVSYLGWLPAANILKPATEHPARRNLLMIAAHLVWGSTTGMIVDRLVPAQPVTRDAKRQRRLS